jgi:hypothetical protein
VRQHFLHKRGRHESYGRDKIAVLQGISSRMQWNTSHNPKPSKSLARVKTSEKFLLTVGRPPRKAFLSVNETMFEDFRTFFEDSKVENFGMITFCAGNLALFIHVRL